MSDLKVYRNVKMWMFWCTAGTWVTALFISVSQAGKLDLALWQPHLYAAIPVKQQENIRSLRKLADLTSDRSQLAVYRLTRSMLLWSWEVGAGCVAVLKLELCIYIGMQRNFSDFFFQYAIYSCVLEAFCAFTCNSFTHLEDKQLYCADGILLSFVSFPSWHEICLGFFAL